MGWLGWTLTGALLALGALGVLAALGLRLWRATKALGRDLERASGQLAGLTSPRDRTGPG